jgi:putative transcriptional regulator
VELFWGGPVELDKVLALHSDEFKGGATVPAAPGVALSSPKEVFEALAQGRGPAQLLLALGYAGWAKGQLERELAQKGWAVITAGPELIFGEDHAGKWERAWKMRTHEL